MVRTRVGYAGGEAKDPTYHHLGDHTECVQLDYDPAKITYEQLLAVFWATPNLCAGNGARQYRSLILCHDEAQRKAALRSRAEAEVKRGGPSGVAIEPLGTFYLAEDYHQKFRLREDKTLFREFEAMYPDAKSFRDSTAAARVNGYLGGQGTSAMIAKEIDKLGLSPAARLRVLALGGQR